MSNSQIVPSQSSQSVLLSYNAASPGWTKPHRHRLRQTVFSYIVPVPGHGQHLDPGQVKHDSSLPFTNPDVNISRLSTKRGEQCGEAAV